MLTIHRIWRQARAAVFTPQMYASPLAETPYDLRHAAVSTWLNAGISPTQVAECAGQSPEVSWRNYAKCLASGEVRAAMQFSPVTAARAQSDGHQFATHSVDLAELGELSSPILLFHEGHVHGRPFTEHPHAGFSAVSYLFGDSPDELRTRDSLGTDVVTGPGGIVWTQAGSGVVHQEMTVKPDDDLHLLQLFVNLTRHDKLTPSRVFQVDGDTVPEWHSYAGDRVRVLVGSFHGRSSPVTPAQPFRFLDTWLRTEISFNLPDGHNGLVLFWPGRWPSVPKNRNDDWLPAKRWQCEGWDEHHAQHPGGSARAGPVRARDS